MESSLSVPLAEQLEAFQHIMDQSGKESQMEDIDRLIACVKSIQADLEDTMDEVSYLLEQLQSMKDSSMKVNLGRMQEDMRESLLQVGNQINTVEKAVAEGIQNTIYSLKEKGIQALNQILDIAHVYQGLSRAEALLMQAVDGMERKLVQHCAINGEFCTCYFCQDCVVVNRRSAHYASFLRLILTGISGTLFTVIYAMLYLRA